jgi:hypothetical protein
VRNTVIADPSEGWQALIITADGPCTLPAE